MKKRYSLLAAMVFGAFLGFSQTASLPITEDFELETQNQNCNATINLVSANFVNVSTDGVQDWSPDAGGTSSSSTGPAVDHSPGTGAGIYLYTETSGCNNRTVSLESVHMDWSAFSGVKIEFWYHMFGATMGTMHLDMRVGSGAWTNDVITSWTGNVDQWMLQSHSVFDTAFVNKDSVQMRIRGLTGTSFTSDMAIDDIAITPIVSLNLAGAGLTSPSFPFCAGPALPVAADFLNDGTDTITSFTTIREINGVQDSTTFTGSLVPGATQNVAFPAFTFASGVVYDVKIWTKNPNGMADQAPADDTVSVLGARTGLPAGNYTLNPANPSSATNFTSFADLGTALSNFGTCGAVNVTVSPGTYSESLNLSGVTGPNELARVTIDGGDSSTTTITSANYFTVALDGVSYITLKNMKIENTNATASMAVLFGNGSNYNEVSNSIIEVSTTSTNFNITGVGTSTSTTSRVTGASANHNTVANSVINGGYYQTYFYGNNTTLQVGNKIMNNDFNDGYYYGVYVYYQDSVEVVGNNIDMTSRNNTQADGAYIWYTTNALFTENWIHAPDYGAYIYNFTQYAPERRQMQVVNNMIISDTDFGMYLLYQDSVDIFHNSIVTNGTFNPAFQIGASTTNTIESYDVRNNIFSSANTEAFEMSNVTDTLFTKLDNNAYNSGGANTFNIANTTYADLTAFKTANPNLNGASIEGDPQFASPTNLHIIGAFVNDGGDNSVSILTDIDGDVRPASGATNVDIGADEFSPALCPPPSNFGSVNPSLDSVTIFWTGGAVSTFEYEVVLTGAAQGSGTGVITGSDSVRIGGLTASTTYDYYVREICGRGDSSIWLGPTTFSTANGVPFLETFTSFSAIPSNGWTRVSAGAAPAWNSGTSTSSSSTGPTADHTTGTGGTFLYLETSGAAAGNTDTLTSAGIYIDTGMTNVSLEYWYHMHGAAMGTLEVGVLANGSYTSLGSWVGQQHAAQNDPWLQGTATLSGFQGQSINIIFVGIAGTSFTSDMSIDDVRLFVPAAQDGGVSDIIGPGSGCGLGSSDTVTVEITNFGTTAISNFPVSYVLNSGTPVNATYTGSIAPGGVATYTFAQTVNLSTPGTYTLESYTDITGDGDITNDSSDAVINSIPILSTFPYSEGFESGNGGWTTGGASSSWALGTPSNTVINSAAGGTQAWATSLAGQYNLNEASWVQGPCFDFTNLSAPQFKMEVWWESEFSWDGALLQTSIDGGATWQDVGAFGDPNNWYTDNTVAGIAPLSAAQSGWSGQAATGSAGWLLAEHDLSGLGGVSGVLIRVAFGSDASIAGEGFAFDNVLIQNAPNNDAAALELTKPGSGCGLGAADTVELMIANAGGAMITGFPVSYTMNGGTPVTETYNDTILPGDTAWYAFTTLVNLSATGNFDFVAYTSLVGDGNNLNDTTTKTVVNIPILTTFPYSEGFETGNGGWTTGGTASSWALGTPSNTVINSAAGGTQAWVTSLAGQYNLSEASWVQGPCFDFTNVAAPQFKMNVWWESEFSWDGAVLQSSIDGGTTWQDVGAFGDPNNWYTDNTIAGLAPITAAQQGWTGQTGTGSGGWVLAEHDLSGLGGISGVLLRVAFGSDASIAGEGFAFDDVLVQDAPANDVGVVALLSPGSGCTSGTMDSVTIAVANFGSAVASNVPVSYSLNGGTAVNETIATINTGDTVIHTFSTLAMLPTPGNSSNIDAWSWMTGDANVLNDSLLGNTITNTKRLVPDTEDFDALASGVTGPTVFANGWESTSSNAAFTWRSNIGGTGSTATGPTSDVSGSGTYMYTEASSGFAGDITTLTSTCYDVGTITGVLTLEYYYHMYGSDIIGLEVEMDSAGTWVSVDTINGQQQTANADTFLVRMVQLPAGFAALQTTKIRFVVIRGASFNGDVSIDEVTLSDQPNAIVDNRDAINQFRVNPNPSNGEFVLYLPELKDQVRVDIRDVSGKVVFESNLNAAGPSNHSIDLSGVAKGIYFLRISNDDATKTEKLIIK